jgi:ribosomal protein S6--L-glutamate ligase
VRLAIFLQKLAPDTPPRINPVTGEVIDRLRERGALVDLLVAEDEVFDLAAIRPAHDLYVLKSKSPLTLSVAAILADAGAAVVNSVRSCTLIRDKIVATALLAAWGVPVPPSWATGEPVELEPLLEQGPFWLKPQRGSKGLGVRRVVEPSELAGSDPARDACGLPLPVFAQQEVPGTGRDLKVYVVGERAWALTKPWPVRSLEDKMGTPAALPTPIAEAALRCGRALGLEIYGVDFLVLDDRFYAVDVNAFPGSRGPIDLPRYLADYLYARALRPDDGPLEATRGTAWGAT